MCCVFADRPLRKKQMSWHSSCTFDFWCETIYYDNNNFAFLLPIISLLKTGCSFWIGRWLCKLHSNTTKKVAKAWRNSHVLYVIFHFFVAADAHLPAHPFCLSAELAVEAETAPEGGNDYSIRECVITVSLLCILSQLAECDIFVFLICEMRKKHI